MEKEKPFFKNLEEQKEMDEEYKQREKEYKKEIYEKMLLELEKEGFIIRFEDGSFKPLEKFAIEQQKIFFLLTTEFKLKRH